MSAFLEFLLRMGDNTLVLGHRVSEWCGHAPILEEDIALANTALDLIGQTQMWLGLAAEVEGKGRTADDLAYRRDVIDFRNCLLTELPNRDFGHTLMRQFLFDTWHKLMLTRLCDSSDERVAAIAMKALKEVSYHLERSADTVIGLGDGTEESHAKMQAALNRLWPYVGEMFEADRVDDLNAQEGVTVNPSELRADYDRIVSEVMAEATLRIPDSRFAHRGGRDGSRHTEHLGHMLAVMQFLPRAYPDARW
ncbi:1,2-phenylacetyl-CoA epoxidase subunit PaaC [Marivivens sp. LCG002]|uniref:1,2-phenylacetyl-CoA epoxidase subunit PaaC n=1 Tax=Marivivens sp. LCG002 TaxID=3051171 RepID=UPI0025539024|nr:1,2-phenylacetyl-CoA epoxidase subunit PaaC [Marivivens sp. LCG002]WIV51217.1 1,2-phenylacetyl-CoA epoxidase subunit PaaC [Marivivens sp. LCG002]